MIPLETHLNYTKDQNHPSRAEVYQWYIDCGVHPSKIRVDGAISFLWSITRKCFVGGKGEPPSLEVIFDDKTGNGRLTYDNNRIVNVRTYRELTPEIVRQINESENGIVASNWTYGRKDYRFEFIPNN